MECLNPQQLPLFKPLQMFLIPNKCRTCVLSLSRPPFIILLPLTAWLQVTSDLSTEMFYAILFKIFDQRPQTDGSLQHHTGEVVFVNAFHFFLVFLALRTAWLCNVVMSVCQSVQHFGPDWNISTIIRLSWNVVQMNPNDFGDLWLFL